MIKLKLIDQGPTPRPTIRSLPPELIGRILELAVEDTARNYIPHTAHERESILRRATLVCKAWSEEAQVLLWGKVVIQNESRAQRLLCSPGLGKYRTKELDVSIEYDLNDAKRFFCSCGSH